MMRRCLDYVSLLLLILYSLATACYMIVQLALLIVFITFIHDNSLDYFFFFAGLIVCFAHYSFMLICMTSTIKLTKLSDRIFSNRRSIFLYSRLRNLKKPARTFSILIHMVHITYMMAIPSTYYDPHTRAIKEEYDETQKQIIEYIIKATAYQFFAILFITMGAMILFCFYICFM